MRIHLVNPSDISFGTAVITPRWLYVLAAGTPREYGDPRIADETLEAMDFDSIAAGDVVGIGIHTFNALRGYEIGREARKRGALVIFGGIHPTLYPDECFELGGAHATVKGDGDQIWATVLSDVRDGTLKHVYEGGRISGSTFQPARWDLLPPIDTCGIGADAAGLSTLFLLFGMAYPMVNSPASAPRTPSSPRSSTPGGWASASSCCRMTTFIR
jgi:radical SAM superfamily enzyme YgiQ (UPF0313 family)